MTEFGEVKTNDWNRCVHDKDMQCIFVSNAKCNNCAFGTVYQQGREDVIDEIKKSLKEVGYEYDSNMNVDNNIGSALLGEFSKGYIEGNKDRN